MRKDNHMDPTLKKHILKDEGIPNDRLAASHWVKLLGADESLCRKSQAQGSLLLFTGVDDFSTPVNVWIICALQFTDIKY